MGPFRRILIAADLSERSRNAFRLACALADESMTTLRVLHVVEQIPVVEYPGSVGGTGPEDLLGPATSSLVHHQALTERLRELYVPARPLEVSYEVVDGQPAEALLRAAHAMEADLIVLGTHGRTGLRRLVTGSVAESVLRRAECPVLALRAPESWNAAEPVDVILVPTDFSEYSQFAIQIARQLAEANGSRLILLHVAPQVQVLHMEVPVTPIDPAVYSEALETLRKQVDGPTLKYPVEIELREGEAIPAILEAAEECGARLIVLGTHGRTGLGRALLGSVAEAVIRHAPCPVLAVKRQPPAPTRSSEAAPGSVILI